MSHCINLLHWLPSLPYQSRCSNQISTPVNRLRLRNFIFLNNRQRYSAGYYGCPFHLRMYSALAYTPPLPQTCLLAPGFRYSGSRHWHPNSKCASPVEATKNWEISPLYAIVSITCYTYSQDRWVWSSEVSSVPIRSPEKRKRCCAETVRVVKSRTG